MMGQCGFNEYNKLCFLWDPCVRDPAGGYAHWLSVRLCRSILRLQSSLALVLTPIMKCKGLGTPGIATVARVQKTSVNQCARR